MTRDGPNRRIILALALDQGPLRLAFPDSGAASASARSNLAPLRVLVAPRLSVLNSA